MSTPVGQSGLWRSLLLNINGGWAAPGVVGPGVVGPELGCYAKPRTSLLSLSTLNPKAGPHFFLHLETGDVRPRGFRCPAIAVETAEAGLKSPFPAKGPEATVPGRGLGGWSILQVLEALTCMLSVTSRWRQSPTGTESPGFG